MTTIPLVHVGAQDAPVACTLTPADYRRRAAELSSLAARSVAERASIDGGQRLSFIDIPALERELLATIAAEAQCCAFLRMTLSRAADRLVLDITGPAEAQPIIDELFA